MPSSTTSAAPSRGQGASEPAGASPQGTSEAFRKHFAAQLPVLLRNELLHLREALIGSAALILHISLGWTPEDLREALPDADKLRQQLAECVPYVVSMAAGAAALAVQRKEVPPAQPAHEAGPSSSSPRLDAPKELPQLTYDALWDYIAAQRKNGSLVDDPAWVDGTKAKHKMTSRVQASLNALEKDFAAAALPLLAVPALRRAIEALSEPLTAEFLASALQSLEPFPLDVHAGPQPLEPKAPSLEHAEALLTHGIRLSRRMQAAASLRASRLAKEIGKRCAGRTGMARAWHAAAVAFPGSRVDNKEQVTAHMSAAHAWNTAALPDLDGIEAGAASNAALTKYFGAMDKEGAIAYEQHFRQAIVSVDRALTALRDLSAVPAPLSLAAHRARVAAGAASGPATGTSSQATATPAAVPEDEWTRQVKFRCHRRRADAGHHLAAFKWKCPLFGEPKRSAILPLAANAVQDLELALAYAATPGQKRAIQTELVQAQKTLGHIEDGTGWWLRAPGAGWWDRVSSSG